MAGFRTSEQTPFDIEMRFTMNKLLSCRYNMDTNRVEARFADGSAVAIDCIAVEDEYGNTPAQQAGRLSLRKRAAKSLIARRAFQRAINDFCFYRIAVIFGPFPRKSRVSLRVIIARRAFLSLIFF